MSRRADSEESAVSLFPFLSILACVIGSLTLMITALALTGMNTGPAGGREESEVRRAEEYMVLQREIEECQAKIDALSKATGEQGKLAKLLAEAQKQRQHQTAESGEQRLPLTRGISSMTFSDPTRACASRILDRLALLLDEGLISHQIDEPIDQAFAQFSVPSAPTYSHSQLQTAVIHYDHWRIGP